MLLGHGMDDPKVDPQYLDSMASALEAAGVEFEAFRYEHDEFIDDRDRIDFHLRLADFFERELGEDSVGDREAAAPASIVSASSPAASAAEARCPPS